MMKWNWMRMTAWVTTSTLRIGSTSNTVSVSLQKMTSLRKFTLCLHTSNFVYNSITSLQVKNVLFDPNKCSGYQLQASPLT